jgi:Uma2 family endonuclease
MVAVRAIPTEKLYTAAEFEAMPEFGDGYELIEGRIVKKPIPSDVHSNIVYIILEKFIQFDTD